jgi:geranylgeranyl pyrophosphate synthase
VTTLLYLGFDLLDDIADGDLHEHWATCQADEVQLAAAGLLSAVPLLALCEIDAPSEIIVELQRTLARGLMVMGEGQQRDMRLKKSHDPATIDVEASVQAKGGGEFAMFAEMAARLAGGTETMVAHYASFARDLGTGLQLASDCQDLFFEATSRDLRNGTRTLPIALYLGSVRGSDRIDFLRLLDECRDAPAAQTTVRRRLRAAGVLWQTRLFVEVYRQRAVEALERASPRTEARALFSLPLESLSTIKA